MNSTIRLPVLFFVYNSKTREGQWNLWDYKAADRSVVTQRRQSLWLQGDKTQVQTCRQADYAHVHSLVPFIILQPPTTQMTSQNKCASTASLSQHPVQAGWVLFIHPLLSRLVSVDRSDLKTRSVQEPRNTQRASSAGRLESKHSLRVNSGLSDSPRHLLSQVEWLLMLKLMKSYQNGPWGNKTGEKLAGGQLVL